jgi:hypothetical protein
LPGDPLEDDKPPRAAEPPEVEEPSCEARSA